jgi:DNA-binding transcriptional ArsR family regulator
MNTDGGNRVSVSDSDAPGGVDACDVGAVLITRASRRLRRELRPLAWMVLEEISLDALSQDGRLIAHTSARRLAEGLGIDPGTAAGALRALRRKGLLALERESGLAGRFGLAVYVVEIVEGLTVVLPDRAIPHMEVPDVGQPSMATSDAVAPVVANRTATPAKATGNAAPEQEAKHQDVCREALGQGALDFGLGTA